MILIITWVHFNLIFSPDHLQSTMGMTYGQGSFAVHFGDHLQSGIICSTVQIFNHTLCGSTPLCRPFKGVQPQGYMSGQ